MFYDASEIVLAHLRAHRGHLDMLITYLEQLKEHRDKNTMFVVSPVANGAAPAIAPGSFKTFSTGDGPQPPPIPQIKEPNQ